jgi:hypothetical protein
MLRGSPEAVVDKLLMRLLAEATFKRRGNLPP